MGMDDLAKWKLFELPSLFAPDIDDPGVQDRVTIYKRYCSSVREILDSHGHLRHDFYAAGKSC